MGGLVDQYKDFMEERNRLVQKQYVAGLTPGERVRLSKLRKALEEIEEETAIVSLLSQLEVLEAVACHKPVPEVAGKFVTEKLSHSYVGNVEAMPQYKRAVMIAQLQRALKDDKRIYGGKV